MTSTTAIAIAADMSQLQALLENEDTREQLIQELGIAVQK